MNFFSLAFTSELTAFMPNVAYSLVLSRWASVAFPSCGEVMTPSEEGAFSLCDMSHILFEVCAISLQETVLVAFTPVGDGAVVELLMTLRANVTFFGSHQSLFSHV